MRRRRKLFLGVLLTVLVAIPVVLHFSKNRLVWSRIVASLHEVYGLEVEAESVSLSLLSGKGTIRGIRITEAGSALLEADEVQISASLGGMLRGVYDFEALTVIRPVFHIVVEAEKRTNFGRIFAERKPAGGPAKFTFLENAHVMDGTCLLADDVTDPDRPLALRFESLQLALSHVQISGEPRSSANGDMRLDALLVQARAPCRIALVAWAPSWRSPPTFALHAAITGLDLAQFPQYAKKSIRSALGGDVLHLAGNMRAIDGSIVDGAIGATVVETGSDHFLRFGGTTSDLVIDQDSRLALLFDLPFARLGHLGELGITTTLGAATAVGKGIVGAGESAVSGVADTIEGMIRLDPLGALEAAGGGVLDSAKALGGGVVDGVRRLFGGLGTRAENAHEDVERERRFAALHHDCRRAMIRAALESAGDSSNEREQRIETELLELDAARVVHDEER